MVAFQPRFIFVSYNSYYTYTNAVDSLVDFADLDFLGRSRIGGDTPILKQIQIVIEQERKQKNKTVL